MTLKVKVGYICSFEFINVILTYDKMYLDIRFSLTTVFDAPIYVKTRQIVFTSSYKIAKQKHHFDIIDFGNHINLFIEKNSVNSLISLS